MASNLFDRLNLHELTVRQDRDRVEPIDRMHRGVGEFQVLVQDAARIDLVVATGELLRVLQQRKERARLALLVDLKALEQVPLVLQFWGQLGGRQVRVDLVQAEPVLVFGGPEVQHLLVKTDPKGLGELGPHRLHVDDGADRFDTVLAASHGVVDLLDLCGRLRAGEVLEK